jgi:hypothetical protein
MGVDEIHIPSANHRDHFSVRYARELHMEDLKDANGLRFFKPLGGTLPEKFEL